MKLGPHGMFLVKFVASFVQDELARWEFDLDYSGYVLEHFSGFEAEAPRLAAKFARTIDRTYESCAWMDDVNFAYALSNALDEFLGTPTLQDFY